MNKTHVEFNTKGLPTVAFMEGGAFVMTTKGTGSGGAKATATAPSKDEEQSARKWVPWGVNDDFPIQVLKEVRKSTIAAPALRLLTKAMYGQRIVPVKIKGYTDTGKEQLEYVDDPKVKDFIRRNFTPNWRISMIQDYFYYANCFPEVILTRDRSAIYSIKHNKALKCRLAPFDVKLGRIDKAFVSANFPNPGDSEIAEVKVIDSFNWFEEIERIREDKAFKYIYPTCFPDVQNDYYSLVYWDGSRSNGWLEISNSIPQYKRALFKNQTTIKYHIQIPDTYWTDTYPDFAKLSLEKRQEIMDKLMEEINSYLVGTDNAMKTFISSFKVDRQTGKANAGWSIVPIDDKMKEGGYLPDSSAANAEILFSMLVNPAITGAGMPSGNYTGGSNSGGSNIRESWLVMMAMLQADRDLIYQVWDFIKEFNDYDRDIELRTIDQVLTTLDQGKGTEKVIG